MGDDERSWAERDNQYCRKPIWIQTRKRNNQSYIFAP